MPESNKTLHFKKNVNASGRRFIAGQDVLVPVELADRLLAYRTEGNPGEQVCVEADMPPKLDRLNREELNTRAAGVGVEDPETLANKHEVMAALADKGVIE